jgi:hypothetical protein
VLVFSPLMTDAEGRSLHPSEAVRVPSGSKELVPFRSTILSGAVIVWLVPALATEVAGSEE